MIRLKRLLRPLIPDRVMARYRLHQHSRQIRVNVDVFLDDSRTARRWLRATPDTYRVRLTTPLGEPPTGFLLFTDDSLPVDQELVDKAVAVLADPEIGAGVVGDVEGPGLVNRRRVEPKVGPRLIAVRPETLDEVGGSPPGEHPLPGLLARLRDAGHRIGLVPVPPGRAAISRTDPIEADPVVILAAVPMHDIGGGARSTQLTLEFVRQGFHVTLVSLYQAQESVDLGLRYIHPNLEQLRIDNFEPESLLDRCSQPGLVLVEAPAVPLISQAGKLQKAGWTMIYDMIDNWSDPALGGDWFRSQAERDLVTAADRVIASAPDLVDQVKRMGREAVLVPNAVNAGIFGVDLPARPDDLPEAEMIIGYHGSLYGDWFDWDALRSVAEAFPEAAIVLIGDDKAPRPAMPANIHFLGLKPQTELPAYLQRFSVGVIPFKVSDTTHAVSPLKAYEYLASGVPIAAPPLRALEELQGISFATDLFESVRLALKGPPPDRNKALREHSWASRIRGIMPELFPPAPGEPATVVIRPPVHFARNERPLKKG